MHWTRETNSGSYETYMLVIDDNEQVKLTKNKRNKQINKQVSK